MSDLQNSLQHIKYFLKFTRAALKRSKEQHTITDKTAWLPEDMTNTPATASVYDRRLSLKELFRPKKTQYICQILLTSALSRVSCHNFIEFFH